MLFLPEACATISAMSRTGTAAYLLKVFLHRGQAVTTASGESDVRLPSAFSANLLLWSSLRVRLPRLPPQHMLSFSFFCSFHEHSRRRHHISRLFIYPASSSEFTRIVIGVSEVCSGYVQLLLRDKSVDVFAVMKNFYSFKLIILLEYPVADRAAQQKH